MSAALKRRFNTVHLPLPSSVEAELEIVESRLEAIGNRLSFPPLPPIQEQLKKVISVFQELRKGETLDGTQKIKCPSATLSTAEIIDLFVSSWSHSAYFGDGKIALSSIAPNLVSCILKDPQKDKIILQEYLEAVLRRRKTHAALYKELHHALSTH